MDSLKRIHLACRAAVAALAPSTYFISTGILMLCCISIRYTGGSEDNSKGVLRNAYLSLDPELVYNLITGCGWLAATIISGTIVKRYFKEENQGIHYLAMPLSNPERFATSLLMNWLFASIVSFLPLFLICLLGYYLSPDYVLMVSPLEHAEWLLIGPLLHLVTLSFWLFPSVAYGKKAGFVIVAGIIAFIIYLTNTRGRMSDRVSLKYDYSVFDANDVVGLHRSGAFKKELAAAFQIPDLLTMQMVLTGFAIMLLFLVAYLAFTRKTV